MKTQLRIIGEWFILALAIGTVLFGIYLSGVAYAAPRGRCQSKQTTVAASSVGVKAQAGSPHYKSHS